MGHGHASDNGSAIRNAEPALETTTRILDSALESVDCAESFGLEMARRSGFRKTTLEQIGLAIREIMTNAVVHGNRGRVEKEITLTLTRTPHELRIVVSDQGDGFDPNCLPDPLSAQGLVEGSGRGVYLARTFMNEFRVQRDGAGATVTMVKYVSSSDAGR